MELLDHVRNQIADSCFLLSALLTKPKSVAWSLYNKLGYKDVYLLEDIALNLEEIVKVTKPLDLEDCRLVVRNYVYGDEKYMLNIYNAIGDSVVGYQKRDLDYWIRRYVSVMTYDGFFYEPFDPDKILIAEENGVVYGYCFLRIAEDRGYIREIFSKPGEEYAITSLLATALEKFASKGVQEVVFFSMLGSLYPIFKNIINSNKSKIVPHDLFMVKIIDHSGLIKSLEPEILERLKDYNGLTIGLRIGNRSLAFGVEPDRIDLEADFENSDATFSMEEEPFLKLLFGAAFSDEIIEKGRVSIDPDNEYSRTIFRLLFPKKSFYLSPGDMW
jgi:hypothetical protein